MVFAILSLLVMLPSQRAESTETRVVLMASRAPQDDQQSMTQAVLAHVSDLDVFLDIAWFDEIPADLSEQVALAKDISRDRGAAIVFWYDPRRVDRFFIALPRDPQTPVFSRRLLGAGEGGVAESVALICRGVVRAYLQGYPLAPEDEMENTPSEAANDEEDEAEGEIEVENVPPVDPGMGSPSLEPETTDVRRGARHRVSIDGGYVYSGWSDDNPAIHGGLVAAGTGGLLQGWCVEDGLDNNFRFLSAFGEEPVWGEIGWGGSPVDYASVVGETMALVIGEACDEIVIE
jgi:hypothetical protein